MPSSSLSLLCWRCRPCRPLVSFLDPGWLAVFLLLLLFSQYTLALFVLVPVVVLIAVFVLFYVFAAEVDWFAALFFGSVYLFWSERWGTA